MWLLTRRNWPKNLPLWDTHCWTCKKRPATNSCWPQMLICANWRCLLNYRLLIAKICAGIYRRPNRRQVKACPDIPLTPRRRTWAVQVRVFWRELRRGPSVDPL